MPSLVGQTLFSRIEKISILMNVPFFIHFTGIVTVLNRNPFFPFSALQASRLKLVIRHIPFFNLISSSPSNPPILSCLARSLKLRRPRQISHIKSLLYSLLKH